MTTTSSTSANFLTNALLLNNEGVDLLCSGKPHEATMKIKGSLTLMNHGMRSSHSSTDPMPFSSHQQHSDICLISFVPFLADSCGRNTKFQLFDGALSLSAARPVPFAEDLALYTAAAMLNLAMCFHQMGKIAEHSAFKQDQARVVSIFHKADHLYQAVQHVIEATLEQNLPHATRHLFRFLFVAAQNNCLGIALQLGGCSDEGVMQLKKAMDDMLSIMYKECEETGCIYPHQHSDHEKTYLHEFLLNSTLLDMTAMMTTLPAPCT
jgi:hypothetical protein